MLRRIIDTNNLVEAEVIVSILAARGVHPSPLRRVPRVSDGKIDISYTVEVPVEQLEQANAALKPYGFANSLKTV